MHDEESLDDWIRSTWRSVYPAHLPASVWRLSGDERVVTAGDVTALLSLRRKSA
jgi:hypothetical protein